MEIIKEEWKEWSSLKGLTEKFPQQFQHGLSVFPLKLTCLDAFQDHLVIGTNAGLVYLVHLPSYNIIKLRCENITSFIQSVAAVSSVDDMIAAGCHKGSVTIFQIPPASSDSLSASQGSNMFKNELVPPSPKRFMLNVHCSPVTSLAWSKNGMKLFSGDREGNVALIEVDYEKCECMGKRLFKVDTRIVQLSYSRQVLAVSYEERCLLYNFRDESKVFVGKKPRSPPGSFGCAFGPSEDLPTQDILYCARPAQRIWSANTQGLVLFSYIQKKLPAKSFIKLLDIPKSNEQSTRFSFGLLYHYKGSTLVSQCGNCLIILDVSRQKVLGYCDTFHKISGIAISGDNIFVLDNRNIICLSPLEPSFSKTELAHSLTRSLHLPAQENLNLTALSEIKTKFLPNKHLMSGIAKLGETVASKISEIANPTIISGNKDLTTWESKGYSNSSNTNKPSTMSTRIPNPYLFGLSGGASFQLPQNHVIMSEKISAVNSEQAEAGKRNQEEAPKTDETPHKIEASVVEKEDTNCDVVIPSSLRGKRKTKNKLEWNLNNVSKNPGPEAKGRDFNEDSRTYEDFKETIEENESLLADVLNLSCLRMDHDTKASSEASEYVNDSFSISSPPSSFKYRNPLSLNSPLSSMPSSHYVNKDVTYGPPSGSSMAHLSLEDQLYTNQELGYTEGSSSLNLNIDINLSTSNPEETASQVNTMPPPEEWPWDWQKYHLPAKPQAYLALGSALLVSEGNDLYCSQDLHPLHKDLPSWKRRRLLLEIEAFANDDGDDDVTMRTTRGRRLRVRRGELFSAGPLHARSDAETETETGAGAVACSTPSDRDAHWTLHTDGKVIASVPCEGKRKEVEIACQELQLGRLMHRLGVVWAITRNGRIAYRIGVRPSCPAGLEWGIMLHGCPVRSLHLGRGELGWMMDAKGALFASLRISRQYPQGVDARWWQVGMSDYMLGWEESSPRERSGASITGGRDDVILTSNDHFLFILHKDSPFAFAHPLRSFVGHRWECLGESSFCSLSGGGLVKGFGSLYCSNELGDLFVVSPHSGHAVAMDLPRRNKVASFSSRPDSLWILTTSGEIFIRTGISGSLCLGSKWVNLDLRQIADVQFEHVSLSAEVVWAVDAAGEVYMRQGPLTPKNKKKRGLDPAWLHVDSNELKDGAVFKKVYVGSKSHLVWGIDSEHRIYVREAIFPEISTGTSWVLVPGILAQSISISEDRVFVVTPHHEGSATDDGGGGSGAATPATGGQVFERMGVSEINYIGDIWRRIPTHYFAFTDLTVSVDNCLWGLDEEGSLFSHASLSLVDAAAGADETASEAVAGDSGLPSGDLDDWEIV